MTKEQIIEGLIAEASFSVDYHTRKLAEEVQINKISPREYEINYHRRKIDESKVLLEILEDGSTDRRDTKTEL